MQRLKKKKLPLRLLPLLICLPFFVLYGKPLPCLILAPMLVYLLGSIKTTLGAPRIDSLKRQMLIGCILYSLVFFILSVSLPLSMLSPLNFNAHLCMMLYLVVGVLQLRTIRHDLATINERKFKLYNLGTIGLAVVVGPVMSFVLIGAGYALKYIISFLLVPLALIQNDSMPEVVPTPAAMAGEATPAPTAELYIPEAHVETGMSEGPPLWLLISIGVILFAAFSYFIFRLAKGNRSYESEGKKRFEAMDDSLGSKSRLSAAELRAYRDSVHKIRRLYRRFLRLYQKRGFTLKSSDTSLIIGKNAASKFDPEATNRIRELYIHVRYDTEYSPTDEDIELMEAALRTVRESRRKD